MELKNLEYRYIDAIAQYQELSDDIALRTKQELIHEALKSNDPVHLSEEMRLELRVAFEMLLNGETPELIRPTRPRTSTLAKSCRTEAVQYILMAEKEGCKSSRAKQAVSDAYRVRIETIREWYRELKEQIVTTIDQDPEVVHKGMMVCAKLYREHTTKRGKSLHY